MEKTGQRSGPIWTNCDELTDLSDGMGRDLDAVCRMHGAIALRCCGSVEFRAKRAFTLLISPSGMMGDFYLILPSLRRSRAFLRVEPVMQDVVGARRRRTDQFQRSAQRQLARDLD